MDGGLPPIVAPTLGGLTAIAGDSIANREFYLGTLALERTTRFDPSHTISTYRARGTADEVELNFVTFPGAIRGRPGAGMGHRLVWTALSPRVLRRWQSRLAEIDCGLEERDGALHFSDPDGLRHEMLLTPDVAATADELRAQLHAVRIYSDDPPATTRRLADIVHGHQTTAPASAGPLGGLIVDGAPPIPGRVGAGSIHHIIWKLTGTPPRHGQAQPPPSDLELVGSDQCAGHRRLFVRGPGGLLLALEPSDMPGAM